MDEHLLALAERQRALLDVLPGALLSTTSKASIGSASVPSKWKWRPVSASISTIGPGTPWPPTRIVATFGCTRIRNEGESGRSATRSRSQRSTSIATVSSESTTPSPSQVGQGLVRISRTPSVTFWRVISTSPSGEISTT